MTAVWCRFELFFSQLWGDRKERKEKSSGSGTFTKKKKKKKKKKKSKRKAAALPRHQEETGRQNQTSAHRTNVRKILKLAHSSPTEVISMQKGLKNTRTK